jgi:Zn-dependent alcohol dehydrogenase
MKYRAAVYAEHGKPLVVDEVEFPDPAPDQVLVKLFASGICHSQLHQLHNPEARTPAMLGHEATGVVIDKGRDVTHVKEGDHVMLTWLPRAAVPGWQRPAPARFRWREHEFEAGVFTWAEHSLISEQYVVPLGKDVRTDVTAIIGCAVMTGAGAVINTAQVRPGESVAVFGVGGVGLCAITAAAASSAYPIIAVDLSDDKLEFAKKFGATHGVNASREDPVARVIEITGGGADYAFDAIGVPVTMEQILRAVRPGIGGLSHGGTAVLIGVPQVNATLDMRSMLSGRIYRGSIGGSSSPGRDFPIFVRWFQQGTLKLEDLVTERYSLDRINDGVHALERGEIFGRSIIEF